jgi:hypothetical protein
LIPSNLGQIIGRLMTPDADQNPADPTIPRTIIVNARGERQRELVTLLGDGIERSSSEIALALDTSHNNAAMLLTFCMRRGIVKRRGERNHFMYSLP